MSGTGIPDSLYGTQPPPVPEPAPGLLDQVVGVFTEPVALFKRLAATPVWGGALALLTAFNLAVAVLWARKVDVDALLRPVLERNPRLNPEDLERILAIQARFTLPLAILGGLVGLTLFCLLMAWLYWLVGKATAEHHPPAFRQAFAATAVGALVGLPKAILLGIVCTLRNIGGTKPDALSPTALGFYVAPDGIRLHAFFNTLDLFTFAGLLMVFLAARHAMRLKVAGAVLCTAIAAVVMLGLPVLFAS